jgi:hypothetical protein
MAYQATTGLGVSAKIVVPGNEIPLSSAVGHNKVYLSLTGTNYPTTFQLDPNVEDAAGNEVNLGTAFVLSSAAAASAPINFTLTQVGLAAAGVAVYTGTITGGGTNNFKGDTFVVTGFTNAVNNGTFQCSANGTTTLTLVNVNAVAETHAGVAVDEKSVTIYQGTITGGGTNNFIGETFTVAGFVNAANNGTFIATANTTTAITLTNPVGVIESHAGTATAQELTNALTYVAYGFKTLTGNTYQPSGSNTAVATVSADGLITAVAEGRTIVETSYPSGNNSEGTTGAISGNPMYNLPKDKVYADTGVVVLA